LASPAQAVWCLDGWLEKLFAWQVLAKNSSIYSSISCLTTAATEAEIGRLEKPRAFELKRLLASPRPSARLLPAAIDFICSSVF
jgi:hypothetical protein